MTAPTTKRPPLTQYRCGLCNRRLRHGRWTFSRYTGARYCWPGECRVADKKPRRNP